MDAIEQIKIPLNVSRKERNAFLLQNKAAIIAQKKCMVKVCDGFAVPFPNDYRATGANALLAAKSAPLSLLIAAGKAVKPAEIPASVKELETIVIINTTNWLDTCLDVHFPGIWDTSLSRNKMLMHLQEHSMMFDKIIADGGDLKAYVEAITWNALGFNYPGSTQALIFKSLVKQSRNAYMFDQYAKGYVRNHSVLMQYVKIVLCINEPDMQEYGAEYEAWQKYYPLVANKDAADEFGFFFAILEAKVIEGSAVPIGANIVTPTLSVTAKKKEDDNNKEKAKGTGLPFLKRRKEDEPPERTPKFLKKSSEELPVKAFKFGKKQIN